MIKFYCDACGEETDSLNDYEYLCHIDSVLDMSANVYVDKDMNAVSGRRVKVGLCNKCYNETVIESVKKLREIKKLFKIT